MFEKTKNRRKGPGLKAWIYDFLFQGPEGPCSLRKYAADSAFKFIAGFGQSVEATPD